MGSLRSGAEHNCRCKQHFGHKDNQQNVVTGLNKQSTKSGGFFVFVLCVCVFSCGLTWEGRNCCGAICFGLSFSLLFRE